jgi:hypothetical protein
MAQIAKEAYNVPVVLRNSINCYLIEDVLIDAVLKVPIELLATLC